MRRKGDTELVTNEVKLLLAAISMTTSGDSEFHGYSLAKELAHLEGAQTPMSQSTLYRALRRLEERGALRSRWESIEESQADGRDGPPRRYYTITADGVAAAQQAVARSEQDQRVAAWQTWVPSFEGR